MKKNFCYSLLFLVFLKSITTPVFAQKITSGFGHSFTICPDKKVIAWGANLYGALGDSSNNNRSTPVEVDNLSGIIAVAGGYLHSLALKNDHTVWAWGSNYRGQLGDGTTTNRNIPVQVSGLSGIIAIAGGKTDGGDYSLALRNDGTVWAWGWNDRGQLGDGTKSDRHSPVQVSGLSSVIAIAAGGGHTLALKNDGTVWTWGGNRYGQLGDGTIIDRNTPVQVAGLTGIIAIGLGGDHSLALKNDGTVLAWGHNSEGELGDGSSTDRYTPIPVNGLTGIIAIEGGGDHSLALKNDGTVWAWGGNYAGKLGDSSTTNRYTPVQVKNLNGVIAIAAGGLHSLALKNDGSGWAWGRNKSGQLGDGTNSDSYIPVQIVNLCTNNIPIIDVTACDQYPSISGHRVFTESGNYRDTTKTQTGEDSIFTVNLTIHKSSNYILNDSGICSYTYHGKTYKESGYYHIVLKNAIGCDSNIFLNLKLNPASPRANFSYNINDKKVTFTGPRSEEIYRWHWDFGDRSDSDTTYNPVHTYLQCDLFDVTLIVSNECGSDTITKQIQTCKDTSVIAGIVSPEKWGSFKIYPNPTNDEITLESEHLSGKISVEIYNAIGQQVLHSEVLSHQEKYKLSGQSGLYVVRIRDDQGNKKTMKVIKE